MFKPIEEHEFEDHGWMSVGEENRQQCIIFNGPNDRETTIYFDEVEIRGRRRKTIYFYLTSEYGKSKRKTGELEGPTDNYGAVGEYLQEQAEQ